jgi:ectoine hydroxylase-related dioxygenase (phytanoyl-CoA dioxygenase family)
MTTIVLPRPTGNVEQVESDLTEFGYGILSGHLSPAPTAEVRGILGAEIAKEEAAGAVREAYTDRDAKNRRLLTVVDRHPRFQELLEDPTLLRLVAHLLGPSYLDEHYLLHSYSANVTRPGSAAMGIHADIDYLRPAAPYRTFPAFAQVIWFLDDFDEEVGATRVVPRSHLYPEGPALLDPRAMAGASEFVRQLLGYGTVNVGFDQPWRHVRADVAELAVGGRRTLEDTRRQARPETRD